jgi:hypothetical protein
VHFFGCVVWKEFIIEVINLVTGNRYVSWLKFFAESLNRISRGRGSCELTYANSVAANDGENSIPLLFAQRAFKTTIKISWNMKSAQLKLMKSVGVLRAGMKLGGGVV